VKPGGQVDEAAKINARTPFRRKSTEERRGRGRKSGEVCSYFQAVSVGNRLGADATRKRGGDEGNSKISLVANRDPQLDDKKFINKAEEKYSRDQTRSNLF